MASHLFFNSYIRWQKLNGMQVSRLKAQTFQQSCRSVKSNALEPHGALSFSGAHELGRARAGALWKQNLPASRGTTIPRPRHFAKFFGVVILDS